MTCTAPSNSSFSGGNYPDCDMKCGLQYEYPLTTIVVDKSSPDRGFIECLVDKHNPSVTFAGQKYQAISFIIFGNPIHNYNSSSVVGELVIIHNKDQNPNTALYICIPISEGNGTIDVSGPGSYLNKILENINDTGGSEYPTTINLENFKLSKFIPHAKYFTYSGMSQGLPQTTYNSCSIESNYIVFSSQYALPLSKIGSSIFDRYKNNNYPQTTVDNNNIYISVNPPGTNTEDDIYIDCRPVGQDKPEYVSIATKDAGWFSGVNFTDIINKIYPFIFFIIGIIIMICIWKFAVYWYSPTCPGQPNCPKSLPTPKLNCPPPPVKKS